MSLALQKWWVILRQGAGRLRLHSWPALASHLFCLLLGVAWAQSRRPLTQAHWPWSAPAVVLAGVGDISSALRPGQKVAVEAVVDGHWCRLGQVIGTVISSAKPAVVGFARGDLPQLTEVLALRPAASVRYVQLAMAPAVSGVCHLGGRVTYGQP